MILRALPVVVAVALPTAALLAHGPLAQDPAYHAFVDERMLAGIPNFQNVASNILFLAAGIHGCLLAPALHEQRRAWITFFIALIFVAAGSSWYHLVPSDATLVFDRLPMTVAFMAYLCILLGHSLGHSIGARMLPGLVAIGASSVIIWQATGDLRPYVVVQATPVLATLFVVVMPLTRPSSGETCWMIAALACYLAAKIAELADPAIYEVTLHLVSGHSAKHLLAGAGTWCLVAAAAVTCRQTSLSRPPIGNAA